MPEIVTILREEAKTHGVIPFSRFMDQALYCPNLGYYEREQAPGRHGDFYTSVSVGPLFGRLLAAEFARRLQDLPPGPVQILEAGAHDGRLALDILSALEAAASASASGPGPAIWSRIEYWLIEPSARRRTWQARTLAPYLPRIRWVSDPGELPRNSIHGVCFSNELLDAFPVTRLRWCQRRRCWIEMGVGLADERFVWRELPKPVQDVEALLVGAGLDSALAPELAAILPDGFTLDLTAGAAGWWAAAAGALRRGVLMTMDYGWPAELFLHPARAGGTLRAYRGHRLEADVLAAPGLQDLTCHVNFTQVQKAGEAAGLVSEPLKTQAQFLLPIAAGLWKDGAVPGDAEVRQFQTLTHPEHLGSRFQVLVQERR